MNRQSTIRRMLLGVIAFVGLSAGVAYSQAGGGFDLSYSAAVGGGGTSTGGIHNLSSTIGQAGAGTASSGVFTLWGGFQGAAGWDDCVVNPGYEIAVATGATIVPGTTHVPGSTCDSCTVLIDLPFSYDFYGTPYTQASVSNKGVLQFVGTAPIGDNQCMPSPLLSSSVAAFWDNLNTNINDVMGVYTSTVGTAPNRTFIVEWRAGYVANDVRPRFEVLLYEGQEKFELVYGLAQGIGRGSSATIGVQEGAGSRFTQYSCNTQSINQGTRLTFTRCPGGLMSEEK